MVRLKRKQGALRGLFNMIPGSHQETSFNSITGNKHPAFPDKFLDIGARQLLQLFGEELIRAPAIKLVSYHQFKTFRPIKIWMFFNPAYRCYFCCSARYLF